MFVFGKAFPTLADSSSDGHRGNMEKALAMKQKGIENSTLSPFKYFIFKFASYEVSAWTLGAKIQEITEIKCNLYTISGIVAPLRERERRRNGLAPEGAQKQREDAE